MTDAAANRLAEMTDEDLIRVHARLDENDPTHVSVVEAHHLTTVEMARRGLDHGHHADDWTMTVVEVESADVDGPDDIGAPEGMDKAWADTLANGGTVTILLTVDGYVLKADGPTVSDVHVDTIMGGPKKRKKYKPGPLVDADEDMEKRIIRRAGKWVVQSHDGSRDLGTYDTEQEAEDRLEQVERYAKADGYQIPSDVQAAAKKALRWIADGFAGDGFTSVGRGRARQLADGGTVGRETLVKMRAYFARHIIDKDAEGWGDQSNPTPGMVAWYAWGGNPGRAWANRVLGDVEKAYDPDGDSEEEYLSTLDDATLAWYGDIGFLIDNAADVDGFMEKAGNPEPLRDYWRGGGKGKINWGAGGDFTACVAAVSKYMTDEQAKGYCAIRHREVNGFWPGDKRNKPAKKSAGPDDISGVFTLPDGSTYTFFGDSLEKKMSRSEAARVAARARWGNRGGDAAASAGGGGGRSFGDQTKAQARRPGMGDGTTVTDDDFSELQKGSAAPHIIGREPDGTPIFTPERQALHDRIITDAMEGKPVSEDPTYTIMGGGPAAGKSTMVNAGAIGDTSDSVMVNSDDVKAELPEYKERVAAGDSSAAAFTHEESSYIAKRMSQASMERGHDVVLDGTGNGDINSLRGKIQRARANGYKVEGAYATVPTEVAVSRSEARAERTGRRVPPSYIRKTHASVSRILPEAMGDFDSVSLFDTSDGARLIARGGKGKTEIVDQAAYDAFVAKGSE